MFSGFAGENFQFDQFVDALAGGRGINLLLKQKHAHAVDDEDTAGLFDRQGAFVFLFTAGSKAANQTQWNLVFKVKFHHVIEKDWVLLDMAVNNIAQVLAQGSFTGNRHKIEKNR